MTGGKPPAAIMTRTRGRPDMAKWTQDQAVAFEAARECLTDMMSICSAAIEAEEAKASPDPVRLTQLEQDLADLARERAALTVHDEARIAVIRSEYGARIRAHRQQHRHAA